VSTEDPEGAPVESGAPSSPPEGEDLRARRTAHRLERRADWADLAEDPSRARERARLVAQLRALGIDTPNPLRVPTRPKRTGRVRFRLGRRPKGEPLNPFQIVREEDT